jgi:hypothetical protein
MNPTYRYFRHREGTIYKLHTATPTSSKGNTRSDDGGETWETTCFTLEDLIEPRGWDSPAPVEYFPDAPTYRYFRQGCGEWKVQTADPESHEGNFYRNAETPWLSASQSLTDLLAMGATEVGASVEQVPRWAVAAPLTKQCGQLAMRLGVYVAATEAQALGEFTADAYKENPGCQLQQPLVQRVP